MCKKTPVATFVAIMCCYSQHILATENQLAEISVIETEISDTLVNTQVDRKSIDLKQPRDIKELFADKLDINVSRLQSARSGNEGVNIRGLQGNRVTSTIDGIPLPEAQESKHFIAYGVEFGRGDYIETSGIRRVGVQYAGSANSLSGSVNFTTLETYDVLKNRDYGGFGATGYDSTDNSVYGSVGGAVKVGAYQGMLMTTLRNGNHTKNQGTKGESGANRTEPNPADAKNVYILTKHDYRFNPQNKMKLTFEYLRKRTDTELLAQNNTAIDSGTGIQTMGQSTDKVRRTRFSLEHEYNHDSGWLQHAKTQVYYQGSETVNHRHRIGIARTGMRNYRTENAEVANNIYGLNSHLLSYIDGKIPQILRYGLSYHYTKATNYLNYKRPGYAVMPYARLGKAYFNGKPTADTDQHKISVYFEDELAFGSVVVTPQVGLVHYRVKPKSNDNVLEEFVAKKRHETQFAPKFSIEWRSALEFTPYFQYSRGVRTPSPQQLTSYFFENPMGTSVAVVGNPNLKAETADNFELGIKGESADINYLVTAYYNRYNNFIDWKSRPELTRYTSFIQYDNLERAKVYGITAEANWQFYKDFYTKVGMAYARGRAVDNGVKTPINSIQPLKTHLGIGYAGEYFGANVKWTYVRAKADKDIDQSSAYMYNPTGGYSLFDLGFYWKPMKELTFTANINNVLDKKYWNWNDISYLALLSKATHDQGRPASSIPLSITQGNADRYSAPGRNFNIGIRYEF